MASDTDIKVDVADALDGIHERKTGKPLLDLGIVDKVEVKDGKVVIDLLFPDDWEPVRRHLVEDAIYEAVGDVEDLVDMMLESHTQSGEGVVFPKSEEKMSDVPPPPAQADRGAVGGRPGLPGVGAVIAVASGKGGVGKSTVACNLALALDKLGYRVGLLDIDIYGPSLPTLMGIEGRPMLKDKKILPMKAYGVSVMSLGFMMEEDAPVIWRGPIVTGIIRQFLQDVNWGGTDYLIIDLPPGTGDAQLTLAQTAPLDGAIVVTTPSDLALIDAARGLEMFRTLNVEVLGIIENMSYYVCPSCEEKHYIFGEGGGKREAERLGIDLLGEIPLDGRLRREGDRGKPIVAVDENALASKAFISLAEQMVKKVPLQGEDSAKKGLFSFVKS
jgi:ATP-binding protein involved in chromosome partitioning